jgi:hypothetical protein
MGSVRHRAGDGRASRPCAEARAATVPGATARVRSLWERRGLAVPPAQLEVIHADDATRRAVEDWHSWLDRGHPS